MKWTEDEKNRVLGSLAKFPHFQCRTVTFPDGSTADATSYQRIIVSGPEQTTEELLTLVRNLPIGAVRYAGFAEIPFYERVNWSNGNTEYVDSTQEIFAIRYFVDEGQDWTTAKFVYKKESE